MTRDEPHPGRDDRITQWVAALVSQSAMPTGRSRSEHAEAMDRILHDITAEPAEVNVRPPDSAVIARIGAT